MTDLETRRPPFVPTGRPVRRFVVAQVVLGMLFGALWWSGLVAPRLSLGNGSSGSYDTVSGVATVTLSIHNDGLGAVDLRRVTLGHGRLTVGSVEVNGRDLTIGGQTLGGGKEATMVIEFTCRSAGGDLRQPAPREDWVRLAMTVGAPVGLERSRSAGSVLLPHACPG